MSHRLDFLLIRGVFGAALGLAAVVGAVTQAVGAEGEWRLVQGRLVLQAQSATSVCLAPEARAAGERG